MGTKKGHTKYLKPKELWGLFEDYCKEVKSKPFKVTDWVGKDAAEVTRKKERPLTEDGFKNYCAIQGSVKHVRDYLSNRDGNYGDFVEVSQLIKSVIRQDQIEGGMAMIYQHSITQRLNNLVEKTENKHEVSEIVIKHES